MTRFDLVTTDVDSLAAFIYGLIDQTEMQTIESIECATGITIGRVSMAEELRIAQIKQDLLSEVPDDT